MEQSDDEGNMKQGVNSNDFIENLLSIWMLFTEFKDRGNIRTICSDVFNMEEGIPHKFEPYLEPDAFVNLIIEALSNSSDNPHRRCLKNDPYEKTVRDLLLNYFSQNYNTFFTEGGSVDKKTLSKEEEGELLEKIVGFTVTQEMDHAKRRYKNLGFVEIHSGVGLNMEKYCEGIKKICKQLNDLGIRFLVSDNVNKNCYDGGFTPKTYYLASPKAVTTTSAGGSSLRRRKVYKPSRISRKPRKSHKTRRTKPKTKKQYRRKRYTKRCKKSHRRSRH